MDFITFLVAIQTSSARLEWQNQILRLQNNVYYLSYIALPLATQTFNQFPNVGQSMQKKSRNMNAAACDEVDFSRFILTSASLIHMSVCTRTRNLESILVR